MVPVLLPRCTLGSAGRTAGSLPARCVPAALPVLRFPTRLQALHLYLHFFLSCFPDPLTGADLLREVVPLFSTTVVFVGDDTWTLFLAGAKGIVFRKN